MTRAPADAEGALHAPVRRTTRLTPAGRAALFPAAAGLVLSWSLGGVVGLLASTATAALAAALVLARLHAAGLRVASPAAARAHVGDAFPLEVELVQTGLLAARDLRVALGEGRAERLSGRLARLAPGARARVRLDPRCLRRGRQRRLALALASTFPLGLVERRLAFDLPADLLGLPRLWTLADLGLLPGELAADGAPLARRRRGEDELHGVRAWREGESLRRVHWRLSARRGRRIVREMRSDAEPPLRVVLALPVRRGASARRAFERAVGLAASLAEHVLRRGRAVRLVLASDAGARDLGPARGRAGLLRVLTALAEAAPADGDPRAALARALDDAAARRGEACVAVCAAGGAPPERADGVLVVDVERPSARPRTLPGRAWGAGSPLRAAAAADERGSAW